MASMIGRAKTGGRSAGTSNRRTVKTRVEEMRDRIEILEIELGLQPGELDPVEALIRIAASKNTPLDLKVDCFKSVAPFLYPKLANVAVRGDEDGPPIRAEVIDIGRFLTDPALAAAAQKVALAMEEELPAGQRTLTLPGPVEVVEEER
jgi:hypothetical protein